VRGFDRFSLGADEIHIALHRRDNPSVRFSAGAQKHQLSNLVQKTRQISGLGWLVKSPGQAASYLGTYQGTSPDPLQERARIGKGAVAELLSKLKQGQRLQHVATEQAKAGLHGDGLDRFRTCGKRTGTGQDVQGKGRVAKEQIRQRLRRRAPVIERNQHPSQDVLIERQIDSASLIRRP